MTAQDPNLTAGSNGAETYPPGLAYIMAVCDWLFPPLAALPFLIVGSILIFAALMHLIAAPQFADMVRALPAQ